MPESLEGFTSLKSLIVAQNQMSKFSTKMEDMKKIINLDIS